MRAPQMLFDVPLTALYPVELDYANLLLVQFGHKLGPVHRPFRSEAFAMRVDDHIVGVAVSCSTVSDTITGEIDGAPVSWRRDEAVELARLAGEPWATRVLVRLWREVCAPRWQSWTPRIAVSYSKNSMHRGDLYRFDGWRRIREDAGSSGGGAWSRKRGRDDVFTGTKSLWIWQYGGGTG